MDDQESLAQKLVSLAGKRKSENKESYGWLKLEQEAMGGVASDAERAADAAERLNTAIQNVSRVRFPIDLS